MKKALKIVANVLLVVCAFIIIDLRLDKAVLKLENEALKGANSWKQERLKIYIDITRKQDEIIINNKGSRIQKAEDRELLELTQKLY